MYDSYGRDSRSGESKRWKTVIGPVGCPSAKREVFSSVSTAAPHSVMPRPLSHSWKCSNVCPGSLSSRRTRRSTVFASSGRAYTRPKPSIGLAPISGVSPTLGIRPSPRHTISAWFSGSVRVRCQSPSLIT